LTTLELSLQSKERQQTGCRINQGVCRGRGLEAHIHYTNFEPTIFLEVVLSLPSS
jgi:hypothetical protein